MLRRFGSKDLLIAEVVEDICAELAARVADQVSDLTIPISQMLHRHWEQLCEPRGRGQFLVLSELVALNARQPGRYGPLAQVLVEGLIEPIEKNLHHNGWSPVEARPLATAILAQVRGLQLDLAITGDQQRVDDAMHRYIEIITADH